MKIMFHICGAVAWQTRFPLLNNSTSLSSRATMILLPTLRSILLDPDLTLSARKKIPHCQDAKYLQDYPHMHLFLGKSKPLRNLSVIGIQQHWCLQNNRMSPIYTKANSADSLLPFQPERENEQIECTSQAFFHPLLTKYAERIPLSRTVIDAPACVAAVLLSVPPRGQMRWLWRSFHSLAVMTHSYRWKAPTVTQCCSRVL